MNFKISRLGAERRRAVLPSPNWLLSQTDPNHAQPCSTVIKNLYVDLVELDLELFQSYFKTISELL
nr:MAG: hypothetical protein EDM05_30690 [Leptolyngbya sp. IPPAS B-1204]